MRKKEKLVRGMVRETDRGIPVTIIEALGFTFVKVIKPDGKLDVMSRYNLKLKDREPE